MSGPIPHPVDGFMPKYSYIPLVESDEIRLMKVFLRVDGSRGYDIVHTSLENSPPFHAVSYTWGDNAQLRDLRLTCGSHLEITRNLFTALSFTAPQCHSGHLWIDQICIDQSNVLERNHQVKMMGDIYKQCFNCLIWLGEDKELDAGTRAIMKSVRTDQSLHANSDGLQAMGLSPHDESWKRILQIMQRPWFSRAWVLQEVVLPKAAFVIFGPELLDFVSVQKSLNAFNEAYWSQLQATKDLWDSLILHLGKYYGGDKQIYPFHDLLSGFSWQSRTTDDRDLVYAFLGLKENLEIDIQPNYSATVEKTFIEVATMMIKGTRSLDMFRSLTRYGRHNSEGTVPSWVPDWRSVNWIAELFSPVPTYRKAVSLSRPHIWIESNEPSQLTVRGQIIDTIKFTLPRLEIISTTWTALNVRGYLNIEERIRQLEALGQRKYSRINVLKTLLGGGSLESWLPESVRGYPSLDLHSFELLLDAYDNADPTMFTLSFTPSTLDNAYIKALQALARFAENRHLFISVGGKVGLATASQQEDLICILHGSDYPVILRKQPDDQYHVIEVCYFEDAMYGESVWWKEDDAKEFVLG
jgi:hypothetical protein